MSFKSDWQCVFQTRSRNWAAAGSVGQERVPVLLSGASQFLLLLCGFGWTFLGDVEKNPGSPSASLFRAIC